MLFRDKIVLITGASSGIGAGTAVAFAKEDAKLVLGGCNEERFSVTVKKCQEQGAMKEDVKNAGSGVYGNIGKLTIEDVDFLLSTLVRSVFMVTKWAVPHLKETKGAVVNVSSASSKMWDPNLMGYGMAKAALNHFTQSLAQDLGPSRVRANCVLPVVINTPIFMTSPGGPASGHPEKLPELLKAVEHEHALGRSGEVDEVAELILFLSSDAASFITGALVPMVAQLEKMPFDSTFSTCSW